MTTNKPAEPINTASTKLKVVDEESNRDDIRTHTQNMMLRRGSFSEEEAFFLRHLLLDDNATVQADKSGDQPKRVLDDEVLLSVPPMLSKGLPSVSTTAAAAKLPSNHQKAKRRSIKALWEAHASGVNPKSLKKAGSLVLRSSSFSGSELRQIVEGDEEAVEKAVLEQIAPRESSVPGDDDDTRSDQEVRPEKNSDDISVASSWDEEDNEKMFDTWEVLKDEYAVDFGFDYNTERVTIENILADENVGNTFKILGTSADDVHAHPHVLSPPLMDALANFLPAEIQGQNFWMRFSLVRDGASLATLKEYVRAAHYTILAIETPDGQVFGSFTSSIWRTNLGFYGGPPAFVWKMRHSRRIKCASLFDQAQLESEIDVFSCTDREQLIQACRRDSLSVGGDDGPLVRDGQLASESMDEDGFAIALEEDLMVGTTSPSRTFKNPALCGQGDKTCVFNVAGVEMWSFTPCMDVKSAQKLEMTKYFIEESSRAASSHSADSTVDSFGSRDLVQEKFYRRVGDDLESEERRQLWHYANMMNPTDGNRAFGSTPRLIS